MTRKESSKPIVPARPTTAAWRLQDAKARFSELVRTAERDGPQYVTVHGREAVVVISADDFRRLSSGRMGSDLITAMQQSPYPDIDLTSPSIGPPVRDADF